MTAVQVKSLPADPSGRASRRRSTGILLLEVGVAVALGEDDPSIPYDGNRGAGEMLLAQLFGDELVEERFYLSCIVGAIHGGAICFSRVGGAFIRLFLSRDFDGSDTKPATRTPTTSAEKDPRLSAPCFPSNANAFFTLVGSITCTRRGIIQEGLGAICMPGTFGDPSEMCWNVTL